jgi:hypothetical protein
LRSGLPRDRGIVLDLDVAAPRVAGDRGISKPILSQIGIETGVISICHSKKTELCSRPQTASMRTMGGRGEAHSGGRGRFLFGAAGTRYVRKGRDEI